MIKPKLKIDFSDMWKGFDKTTNLFVDLLKLQFDVEISKYPDLLIYSCFSENHLKYNCTKLFFTGENRSTNFKECDYSISFENLNSKNQYFLPYGAFRIIELDVLSTLLESPSEQELFKLIESKSKFCSMVVSSKDSKPRINFFKALTASKKVDSGGAYLNNTGSPVVDKQDFIKDYKFVISFENESYPGYLTEKLFDTLLVKSIPIYWGDPYLYQIINPKRILNRADYKTDGELIAKILRLNRNPQELKLMLSEPVFKNGEVPHYFLKDNLIHFLNKVALESLTLKKGYKSIIGKFMHQLKLKS